ncbi:T-cell immunomodulatory protein-like, partial [Osmerus eperlanus]|uniref:T-cell immunomodulatory protein-like n=1 Tax=Osmerus eperlanus TaxID=29151 RepID=UPI002E15C911
MRMWTFSINVLAFTLYISGQHFANGLQDVTTDLFGSENYGTVAAFGDFNSDKQTDIFIIREQSELVIFLADLKVPYFKPKVHVKKEDLPKDVIITSVVPGDYDGDSQMDLLLTAHLTSKTSVETRVFIFWGNNQTLDTHMRVELNTTFVDQPLVMDFNGDMIPDIFGITADSSTQVCDLTGRITTCQRALASPVNMRVPHSNAFIDLNKDFTA